MSEKFSISSYDKMRKTAVKLREISEEYSKISNKLMDCASTMGAAWESSDNQDFVKQITGFNSELKTMADKLAEDAKTLDQIRSNYESHQDDNSAVVKRLQN